MFESHFGFTAPPFQLSTDSRFYFETKGHSHALSYLKYGVYQREGFIVFTGEVGSGKTTIVRTLMDRLDTREIAAAHIVNTQRDSYGLLYAICTAFNLEVGPSKAQLIATLEVFFTALVVGGRRALIFVDEAQNLGPYEVEDLRMLANFQLGHQSLVQSFLVGQPELRRMLRSGTMEQLRQRVVASCHLGPMTEAETRGYVEHRLRLVGWTGFPEISDLSFTNIHVLSGGLPRRINQLCTRILLACWLEGKNVVDPGDVANAATALAAEMEFDNVSEVEAGNLSDVHPPD